MSSKQGPNESDKDYNARILAGHTPDKVIEHRIVDERGEGESEAQTLLGIAAVENLNLKKNLLMAEFPDSMETIENIDSGLEYDLLKEKLESERKSKKGPVGQAKMEVSGSKASNYTEAKTEMELVKKLYDKVDELTIKRNLGQEYDVKELRRLNRMRDKLFGSLLSGQRDHGVTKRWSVWTCPTAGDQKGCGEIVFNSRTCPSCGYVNKSATGLESGS